MSDLPLHQSIARKIATVDPTRLHTLVRDELHSSTVFYSDPLSRTSMGHATVYESGKVRLYGSAGQWPDVRRAVGAHC